MIAICNYRHKAGGSLIFNFNGYFQGDKISVLRLESDLDIFIEGNNYMMQIEDVLVHGDILTGTIKRAREI